MPCCQLREHGVSWEHGVADVGFWFPGHTYIVRLCKWHIISYNSSLVWLGELEWFLHFKAMMSLAPACQIANRHYAHRI